LSTANLQMHTARHLTRVWNTALWMLALALLAACGRDSGGQQAPDISGAAIVSERETIADFALVRAWPDSSRGSLALAVEFSRPLVSTQEFDALLRFEEDIGNAGSGWSLSPDGTTLRYPYVQANTHYTLLVSANLLAADGSALGENLRQRVYTGALEPVVGFASQGSVLPARDSRGLPVVAVNVPEVDVEFLRVRENELPLFFRRYQHGGRRDVWDLDNRHHPALVQMADPVYVNRFILDGKQNERTLTYLPIQTIRELQQPGLYFAVMKRSGSFGYGLDTTFFTVSDIGLHTRAYQNTLFVHAASLATGAAAKRVDVSILNAEGEPVYRAQTDTNGNALLDYQLDAAHVLVASSGRDVTLLPFNQSALDLSEFAVSGRGNTWFDVYAWSGRDLYRPGETVRVSALMRDFDGNPIPAQPMFVRLKQPGGKPFREVRLEPDAQGYFLFEQVIPADAATGRWQVEFRTDPASREVVQGMPLRIEEFLPERMKLDLNSAQTVLAPGDALQLQAQAAYLYGAPASGNRFTARLAVSVEQHPLDSMPGWFFGDPTQVLPREAREVIDTTFPADGRLREDIALPDAADSATPIAAVVTGSVYESGGRTVTRSLKRVLWPAPALVALRPLFDDKEGADANTRARFELRRVDAEGNPQPADGLQATLVRERRDYHWNWNNNRWNYDFTRHFEQVETLTLAASASTTTFDFPVQWGEYRVEVFDPATQLTMRYPFVAGWSWEDGNRGLDARPDKVKLALDKTAYRAGETLTVTLTPPHPGHGMLMVESDRLLYVQAIEARPGSTFAIPVTEEWERHDVHITALVFRGGSASSTITPARALGVIHVPMDRSGRTVTVELGTPERIQPEQPMTVTVSAPELAGQDAHVVVSAVDVGILNITRFPVPDAGAHFFAKRRLSVDARDMYGRVIESFAGGVGRLKFGGDMALTALPQARRPTARVQTVDLFSGPIALDSAGRARIALDIPEFNGALRVSALVYAGGRYGKRDAETLVRAPVLAEVSLPRALAPGDASTLTLDVQNFTGRAGRFRVRVDGDGPLTVGQSTRQVELPPDGKATLNFPLTARQGHALASVRVRVDGNGVNSDRRYDLPVRAAWPQVLRTEHLSLDPLAPITLNARHTAGFLPESVNARLVVSALPPIPFAAALTGALRYPYGCAEQTASKGYAALILDEATSNLLGSDGLGADERRERMHGAIMRLAAMQAGNGHFSMWGEDDDVNPVLTPYITEFLLDAREAGFDVPDSLLQTALNRLSEDLLGNRNPFYGNTHREAARFAHQAYSGYVLARVNRAPLGTLRALYDSQREHAAGGLSLVHLGLALRLQGDRRRGQAAISAGFAKLDEVGKDYVWIGDYGSPLRDAALMLALVNERGQARRADNARVIALGRSIDARARASYNGQLWLSTQEQAALARLGKALLAKSGSRVGGELGIGSHRERIPERALFARVFNAEQLDAGVHFAPAGQPPLYASIEVAGIPQQPPPPDQSVVSVVRDWFEPDGTPWQPRPLKEGDVLIARLRVTANQAMPDALLTDLLPAGLELENFNLVDGSQWANVRIGDVRVSERTQAADLRHEEFRDDRYVAALNLRRGRSASVLYLVRAVTPGSYAVPAPLVEDMYRPELRGVGRVNVTRISVVPP